MFGHSYRGTVVWLLIVGMVLGLTLFAGEIPNAVGAALLAAYMAMVLLVARNVRIGSVFESLPNPRARRAQPTEVGREAAARARNHPDYDSLIDLLDIGLVVDEQRPDGVSLRRGRFISLDDDGIRPFAIVHVPETLDEHLAHVRFEMRDEAGRAQYVYEDEKWLRAGETPLLPDYRLPVRRNQKPLDAGNWSMRVLVDGGLVGVHHFNLAPSLVERRRMMSSDGEIRERVWRSDEEEDEALPLSLEELLRQQSRQRNPG
ncbi:MAG: hypothetical protein GXY36_15145 [Chloroflexi bacterium]|nr:hypothetical protein [Chloroflexota bacterium]